MAVTETWLQDKTCDVAINNYNFFHYPRKNNKRGGGVGFYVKSDITCNKIDVNNMSNLDVENIWVEITTNIHTKLLLGCFYRPPNLGIECSNSIMKNILLNMHLKSKNVIIVGDFNINVQSSKISNATLEIFEQFGFCQCISEPTRISGSSNSTIDLIFSKVPAKTYDCGVIPINISDHYVTFIQLILATKNKIQNFITSRYITNDHLNLMYCWLDQQLLNINFNSLSFSDIQTYLIQALNTICPLKTIRCTKPFSPWLNSPDIKAARSARDRLRIQYTRNKTEDNRISYRKAVRHTDELIKTYRAKYLSNVCNKDERHIWKTIQRLQKKEQNFSGPNSISFLSHYCETAKRLTGKTPTETCKIKDKIGFHPFSKDNLFNFQPVSLYEITKTISTLKNGKKDKNDISSDLLKNVSNIITPFIVNCINQSFKANEYPNILKYSKLIPVEKIKGDPSISNFRPISIQPMLSKVFERVIYHQISSYLLFHNKISNAQHGFIKGKSVDTLLHSLNDNIRRNLNAGKLTVVILLDYSKAFDTVDHDNLISTLYEVGFSQDSLYFMLSYLRDRFIQTEQHGQCSTMLMQSGVPQGSVLGPLLFNLYVNSFSKEINDVDQAYQFADDTQIVLSFNKNTTFHEINLRILSTIEKAKCWSNERNLVLNDSKTKVLPIFNKNSTFSKMPFFGNSDFNYFTPSVRNLGVYFNHRLTWVDHFNELGKSFRKLFFYFRQFFSCYTQKKDFNLRFKLLNTLLLPKLTFCITLFYFHSTDSSNIWNSFIRRLASLLTGHFCRTAESFSYGFQPLKALIDNRLLKKLHAKKLNIPTDQLYNARTNYIHLPPLSQTGTLEEYLIKLCNRTTIM